LPLDLQNTRITAEDIIAVLGYASVHRVSMDAARNELKEALSGNRCNVRSQPKSGTTHFHGYATVSIVHDNQRFVFALRFVEKGEGMEKIVTWLLFKGTQIILQIVTLSASDTCAMLRMQCGEGLCTVVEMLRFAQHDMLNC
jgi:hypothetical protein